MKIRTKSFLIISITFSVILSSGFYVMQKHFKAFTETRLNRIFTSSLQNTARQITLTLKQYQTISQSVARYTYIVNFLYKAKKNKTTEFNQQFFKHLSSKRISWIGLCDAQGRLLAGSKKISQTDLHADPLFLAGRSGTYIGTIHPSRFCADTVFSLAAAVVNQKDTLGVLLLEYNAKEIKKILKYNQTLFEYNKLYLVDAKGRLLTLPDNKNGGIVFKMKIKNKKLLHIPEVNEEWRIEPAKFYVNYRHQAVFGTRAYIPLLHNFLFMEMSKAQMLKPVHLITRYMIISALILLLFLLVAVYFISGHISASITHLTRAVTELEKGNLDYPIFIKRKDETGLLASAFISMRQKVKQADVRLKEYNRELAEEITRRTYELKEKMEESQRQRLSSEKLSDRLEALNRQLQKEIDERKSVQQALTESEARYRIVSDLTSDYAFAFNVEKDGTLKKLWITGAIERISGYGKEEISRQGGWESLVHPEDVSIPFKQLGVLLSGKSSVVEYRIISKQGQIRWVRDYGKPVFDEEEQRVTMIYGAIQDISGQKKIEEELKESEQSYRELFDNATDAIYIQNREGKFLAVNKGAEKMYGYPKEFFIGKTPEFLSAPGKNDFQAVGQLVGKAFNGEPQSFEFWGLRKNGEIFPKDVHLHQGSYFGQRVVIAMARDISARKQTEEQLRKLSQALEQSPISIVITDTKRKIEYVNEGFCRTTGFSPADVLGKETRFLRALDMKENTDQPMWDAIEQGNVWYGELQSRKKDGQIFWEDVTAAPLFNEQGAITHYIGFKIDITDKKHLEEQFRQAMKMEAVGRLAGGIAHDFNNLLTVILGYSELLLNKIDHESSYYKKIKQIDKAGRRAESLTSQLLAFSRKQILQPKIIQVNHLISETEKMLRRLIGEHIELLTVLDGKLGKVKADPGQVEQVIMNLAINARDAMSKGGRLVIETSNVFIDDSYARQVGNLTAGAYVRITMSDTGEGMDAETLNRIFEPFFTTKEKGRGTGLGLSTVYGIIKQSKGHISVYSEEGKGTTFKIYLPQISEQEEAEEEKQQDIVDFSGDEFVLIVEDETALRNLIAETLEDHGYRVSRAANGREALQLCRDLGMPPILLLSDLVMPGMGGRQLYDQLHLLFPDMKVIYMSGYTDDLTLKRDILNSETQFIQKPFNLLELLKTIRRTLDT